MGIIFTMTFILWHAPVLATHLNLMTPGHPSFLHEMDPDTVSGPAMRQGHSKFPERRGQAQTGQGECFPMLALVAFPTLDGSIKSHLGKLFY